MAGDAGLLWGCGLALAGVALLRISWGRADRVLALNGLGWTALIGGPVLAGLADGAWGAAMASVCAMAAALALLALAAWEAPTGSRRRIERVVLTGAPARSHRGRAMVTFLIAGPAALAVSVALALAARRLGTLVPLAEADANVLVLALVPLAWPLLAFALLMTAQRRTQLATLAGAATLSSLPFIAQAAIA